VRCGLCGRVAGVHYNDRNQAIYRCRHRGHWVVQPIRSVRQWSSPSRRVRHEKSWENDSDLQTAIRHQLTAHARSATPKGPSVTKVIESLRKKERKLLDLYYADQIDSDTFATEHRDLVTKLPRPYEREVVGDVERRSDEPASEAAGQIRAGVAEVLCQHWTSKELCGNAASVNPSAETSGGGISIDSVNIYPDQLTVEVVGAPPILVTHADEVGTDAGLQTCGVGGPT
jgi:hypothetical protein